MKYYIRGPFEEDSFTCAFDAMVQDPDKVILIEINSPGGDLYSGLEAYAKLHECKQQGKKIVTYVTAQAASAGAFLAWMGDEIYISPCASLMFHKIQVHHSSKWGEITYYFQRLVDKYWHNLRDAIEMENGILDHYAPWPEIMAAYGKKTTKYDFHFTAHEFAGMFPLKVKVGAPPYKLEIWDEGHTFASEEILQAVEAVKEEAIVEEDDDDVEEGEEED